MLCVGLRHVSNKKLRRGVWLIWHAVVWKTRNNWIFNNKIIDVLEMLEEVKLLSWKWGMERLKIASCLFYEWCWNPAFALVVDWESLVWEVFGWSVHGFDL